VAKDHGEESRKRVTWGDLRGIIGATRTPGKIRGRERKPGRACAAPRRMESQRGKKGKEKKSIM